MTDKKTKSAVYKKIQRRRRLMGFFVLVVFVVVCLFTPLFGISSITVTGNKILGDNAVIKASGIKKGDNLFLIDTKKGKKAINALGYVDSVDINRKFFSRVEINIKESPEAAYIKFSSSYAGVNQKGKVVSITKASELKSPEPLITGIALESPKVGEVLRGKKEEKASMVLLLLDVLSKNDILSSVKKISVADPDSVYFVFESDTKIVLGDTGQVDYKLKCLDAVMDELGEVRGGKIDLSDPSSVVYEGGN